nr:HNH endonuclease [uncultured Cupriavidus sp.]
MPSSGERGFEVSEIFLNTGSLMPTTLARRRASAFQLQSGRCFYCHCPMWEQSVEAFAATFHLSTRQARHLQCTAEHLHARVDGGGDSQRNIVAACQFCNAQRHRRKAARDAVHHKGHVERRMARKQWHASWVFEKLMPPGGSVTPLPKAPPMPRGSPH